MKTIVKVVIIVLTVSFTMVNASCSKKSHAFKSNSSAKSNSTSFDAVSTKHQPVRKKYIVSGKRKTILGHEKPIRK